MRSFEKEKFTYKVQHLYVMKVPDQEYYSYSMVIGRLYNGMVVDTSSDFLLADGKSYPYTHCGNHIMATMCHKKTLDYVNTGFECFDIASTKAHKKSSRHFGRYVKLRKRLLILEVCRFKIVDWYICLYKRTMRQRIMFRGCISA